MTEINNTKPTVVWTIDGDNFVATITNTQRMSIAIPRAEGETDPGEKSRAVADDLAEQFGKLLDEATKPILEAYAYATEVANSVIAKMIGKGREP
jgi:hypothetical protein